MCGSRAECPRQWTGLRGGSEADTCLVCSRQGGVCRDEAREARETGPWELLSRAGTGSQPGRLVAARREKKGAARVEAEAELRSWMPLHGRWQQNHGPHGSRCPAPSAPRVSL